MPTVKSVKSSINIWNKHDCFEKQDNSQQEVLIRDTGPGLEELSNVVVTTSSNVPTTTTNETELLEIEAERNVPIMSEDYIMGQLQKITQNDENPPGIDENIFQFQ